MRTLTWYIKGGVAPQTDVGPAYRLSVGYHAVEVWFSGRNPGTNLGPVVIDINDDGVSLLSERVAFTEGQFSARHRLHKAGRIEKGSLITLDIDSVGSIHDLTVELVLEEA